VTHGCNYGEVYGDLKASLYDMDERPKLINFIFGLGGSDIRIPDFTIAFQKSSGIFDRTSTEALFSHV